MLPFLPKQRKSENWCLMQLIKFIQNWDLVCWSQYAKLR
jgi:hypothetical protein